MPLLAGLMIVLLRAIFPAEADIRRAWFQAAWYSDTAFLTLRTFLTRRTKLLFLLAHPLRLHGAANEWFA